MEKDKKTRIGSLRHVWTKYSTPHLSVQNPAFCLTANHGAQIKKSVEKSVILQPVLCAVLKSSLL